MMLSCNADLVTPPELGFRRAWWIAHLPVSQLLCLLKKAPAVSPVLVPRYARTQRGPLGVPTPSRIKCRLRTYVGHTIPFDHWHLF